MTAKLDWNSLSHAERVNKLSTVSLDNLVNEYETDQHDDVSFRSILEREKKIWDVSNVQTFKTAGDPPTKEMILGAWRDLDRSEAFLELIDNSIDAWLQRKARKAGNARKLAIKITIDKKFSQVTYEDNAGGVSSEPITQLNNLVIPGYSSTTALSKTIGSYKTGGKKAIFKLARAVNITTRYVAPSGKSEDAISVQLDEQWLESPDEYKFQYAALKDKDSIRPGTTRYMLQLREEPQGQPWWNNKEQIRDIRTAIQRTYTLLLVKHPEIEIYFDDDKPLEPLEELYEFSGNHNKKFDIRPQKVILTTAMQFDDEMHGLTIELVLGSRISVGVKDDGRMWGIDLYGNDRLFVHCDQTTFRQYFPTGNARQLIRGYINIVGPNVFIPWDTHKRHLNLDREVLTKLLSYKLIDDLFTNWKKAYLAISKAGVNATVRPAIKGIFDKSRKDIVVPHTLELDVDINALRGQTGLPPDFAPRLPEKKGRAKTIQLKLSFSPSEGRAVASYYGVKGSLETGNVARTELQEEIRADLLARAQRGK